MKTLVTWLSGDGTGHIEKRDRPTDDALRAFVGDKSLRVDEVTHGGKKVTLVMAAGTPAPDSKINMLATKILRENGHAGFVHGSAVLIETLK